MTQDEMLRGIEYLREKADVTYGEAEALLTEQEGDLMRALAALEAQGRMRGQAEAAGSGAHKGARRGAGGCVRRAFGTRLIVERTKAGETQTAANISVPFVLCVVVFAPYLAAATAILAVAAGYTVRVEREAAAQAA